MIFRKPYAFFIKNFKLFHFILFTLASLLLYRTSSVYSFFSEFAKTSPNVIGKDLTGTLFASYSYLVIIFLILINIIIIIVMIKKMKPFIFYITNIVLYCGVLVVFLYSHKIAGNLEVMLVEPKVILAVRDFLNIARLLETVSVAFYAIRMTGFDIKKFDFGRDLQDLNISEEDSEEYEVAVDFEGNEVVRAIRRRLRDFKYYYKEYKFILNIIILLFIALLSLIIYLSISKYNKVYKEGEFFNAGVFNMGVKASYILDNDYKGSKITTSDYDIIAVKLSVKSDGEQQLAQTRAVLVIDDYEYYHVSAYKSSLFDIGTVYSDQKVSSEFSDYIFVYQVPKKIDSDIYFKYIDNISQEHGETKVNSLKVLLKPKDIDDLSGEVKAYNIADEIDTSSSVISDYRISISGFDLSDKYVESYNSCVADGECYDFKETIKPNVTANRDKVLLRLDGTISYDNKIGSIGDLYTLFSSFGSIEYVYNGKRYTERSDFNQVRFTRVNKDNSYYIEVDKEIMDATNINLIFNIRNNKYYYVLRGNVNE